MKNKHAIKIKKIICTYIVGQMLTPIERKHLSNVFRWLDDDRNGYITRQEIYDSYVNTFGRAPPKTDI